MSAVDQDSGGQQPNQPKTTAAAPAPEPPDPNSQAGAAGPATAEKAAVHHVLRGGHAWCWRSCSPRCGTASKSCPIYPDVAYGLPAFEDGRWLTLIWGNFFALNPFYYVYVAGAFAFLTGFSEWVLGTKRTIIICVVYQIVAVLVTALVFLIFRNSGWEWAQQRATETDVGFSAGMLAVLSVASATVRPPWRLRLRLGHLGLRAVLHRVRRADGRRRALHRRRAEHAVLVPAGRPARAARPGRCRPGTSSGCWRWSACC